MLIKYIICTKKTLFYTKTTLFYTKIEYLLRQNYIIIKTQGINSKTTLNITIFGEIKNLKL
jgi:hypothetical protein